MNHKKTAERNEARWSRRKSHISVNVCMHEMKNCICTKMAACMNACMCVVFHCIYTHVFIVVNLYVYPIVHR